MCGTRDAASKWQRDWQEHIKSWGHQLGRSSKNLFRHKEHRVSGMTHGDDFVLTGPRDGVTEFKNKMTWVCPIKTNHHLRVNGEYQSIDYKGALGKARNCVSVRSQTCRGARKRHRTRARQLRANTSKRMTEPLDQDQHSSYRSLVARCLFFSHDRADTTFIVNELCQRMSLHTTEPCQVEEASQKIET